MELDGDYPQEIPSFQQTQAHDLFSLSKKRKFACENKEQLSLQVSKHICCETLVEQSLQAKLIYAKMRKGKAPTEEYNDHTHVQTHQQDSTQDSNSTPGESFSHDESSEAEFCSIDSIMVDGSGIHDEVQGDGFRDDEFGHCLTYLGAACDSDPNNQQTDHEEDLEDLLYSNGVISKFEQEIQLNKGKPTIDQEFEHYFSMLML